jgi:hypothetical protein
MRTSLHHFQALAVGALAAAGLAGCDLGYRAPPEPVAATAPTITYRYSDSDDLPRVRAEASAYCARFDMGATLTDAAANDDGTHAAHFTCDRNVAYNAAPTAPVVVPPPVAAAPTLSPPPLVSYGYASQMQYAAAYDNARQYCRSYGAAPRQVNIVENPAGSRTVTFSCDQPM